MNKEKVIIRRWKKPIGKISKQHGKRANSNDQTRKIM